MQKWRVSALAVLAMIGGGSALAISTAGADEEDTARTRLALLRTAVDGSDKGTMGRLAEQFASGPGRAIGGEAAPAATPTIDLAAARRAPGTANVWVAPADGGSKICSTADLPEGGGYVSACAPSASLGPDATGLFSSSRPAPGSTAPTRVVGIVPDDVTEVWFVRADGTHESVTPWGNSVVLDAPDLPDSAVMHHGDGPSATVTFGGVR